MDRPVSNHAHTLPFAFIFLILLLLLLPPYAISTFDQRYLSCVAEHRCGKLNITYPFRENGGKPHYCSHPDYVVECEDGNLTMMIDGHKYQLLDIIKDNQSLTIVRVDILDRNCPHQSIISPFTLDNRFNFADDRDLNATLLLNCDPQVGPSASSPRLHEFSCSPDGTGGYLLSNLTMPNDDNFLRPSCQSELMIPMLKTAAQDLADNKIDAADALEKGFAVNWTLNATQCLACLNSSGVCGFKASLGGFSCFCKDRAHQGTCFGPPLHKVSSRKSRWQVKIGIAVGAVGGTFMLTLVAFIFFICIRKLMIWKRQSKGHQEMENFIRNYGSSVPKRFKYSEVKKMTNSFKEKLGQGGFGAVYKGKLRNETFVAVKLLHELKGNGEDFINEVASISRTSHVNIVTLIGFCLEGSKRALIYEYMSNQSLDKFICGENSERHLGWEKLHQIAVGIARGLEYLHRGCNTRILHFDIKPQNILLDDNLCPKISDFGLSKLCLKKESILSTFPARGTIGYIAPEVFRKNFGGVSHKSDVYSYGMMLIDMVGGRRKLKEDEGEQSSEIYFPDQVYRFLEQENINALGLHGPLTPEENEISRKMIAVGLWCIQTVPSQRPSMTRVIELLEGSIETLQMPPKPYLFSPSRSLTPESFSTLESL